jgi:hypothetical protein
MKDTTGRSRWLREPLIHFLLIGAGLFLLYHLVVGGDASAPREIVISEAHVDALAENFARTWMRPPTPQELLGLVDDYVKEEVFYREAVAMGLDRDDTVIRRRLRQKMEFVSEDTTAISEPDDEQLKRFLTAHPDELQAGRGPANLAEAGDPSMLPTGLEKASPQEVTGAFGEEFAAQLDKATLGQWTGPLQSSFGLHLVRVTNRTGATLPTLAEIRPIVLREWQAERSRDLSDAFYASLRSKYDVRLEDASDATAKP